MGGALRDLGTSQLAEKDKALLRLVAKVNHRSPEIGLGDMRPLYDAGWDDAAIYFAITVCALFNFDNRWIHATGVHPMSEEAHLRYAVRTAANGYISWK